VKKGHTNLHFRKGNQTTESIYRSDFIARHGNQANVDDEDLRELMKENGRPSTRANIIETL
jgi:reverse gyrase